MRNKGVVFTRENELRERIPVPHDNLIQVRERAAKVNFVCCFHDPRGLFSRVRGMCQV